jgi:predicted dehydrogenase
MNTNTDRRDFIKKGTAAGIGLGLAAALPSWVRAQPASPSNRLRVAVVGTNSRGLEHLACLGGMDNIEIAYVCDVEDGALAKGMKRAGEVSHDQPKALKDFRKALEDKTLDAVTIATPDHWHTAMAILAMDAGKHVYVEKPCSHNPGEGELLLKAIARYNRLVQMGNQRRSFPHTRLAVKEIAEGIIGKAYYAKAWYDNTRGSIGHGKQVPVPPNLDYELWQGPAPRRPYQDNLIPYNWHWFWHWGTGEACNNGTHEIDVCRWCLGVDYPTKVSSTGGRYQFQDDWQTPDTQSIGWEFDGQKSMSWEGRSCNGSPTDGFSRGVMIYGTEGGVLLESDNYTVFDKESKKVKALVGKEHGDPTSIVSSSGTLQDRQHFQNFADAIRDGVPLNSPITEGHKSVLLPQLGNIAQRIGRSLTCDKANGHILGDAEANQLWDRTYEPGWAPQV